MIRVVKETWRRIVGSFALIIWREIENRGEFVLGKSIDGVHGRDGGTAEECADFIRVDDNVLGVGLEERFDACCGETAAAVNVECVEAFVKEKSDAASLLLT